MSEPNLTRFNEALEDTIFSDFVHSTRTEPDGDVIGACRTLMEELDKEGNPRSNRNSYHSSTFGKDHKCGIDVLDNLMDDCYNYTNSFFQKTFDNHVHKNSWWVNIGGKNAYHNPHVHGRTKLIGIFFVTAPEGAGDLVLNRNDGTCYTGTYCNHEWGRNFYITPEVNRLYILPGHLWHWVDYHEGTEERISISINYE